MRIGGNSMTDTWDTDGTSQAGDGNSTPDADAGGEAAVFTEALAFSTVGPGAMEAPVDLLILPVAKGGGVRGPLFEEVDRRIDGLLSEMASGREWPKRTGETVIFPTLGRMGPRRVMLVGLGGSPEPDGFVTARAFAAAARAASRRGYSTAVVDPLSAPGEDGQAWAAEGLQAGRFQPRFHRTQGSNAPLLKEVCFPGGDANLLELGRVRGESVNIARRLVHEPANILDAPELARRSERLARDADLTFEALERADLERLKMGAFLAVARGSSTPPRLIVLRHEGACDGPVIGLVGKGVMFDTGGISIKPALEMGRMKGDMAGGAAVIAAMWAIGRLKIPARVIGIVPAVDNMPDGDALHPGDVIRAMNGRTIEIISTDAEGRLLLADALHYARTLGCTHLVDLATLTGAVGIALGGQASALYGVDDPWNDAVRNAGAVAGETHWPMPLLESYGPQIESNIADLKNSGGREGGSATAALFLKRFAGEGPWVHLDIAATSSRLTSSAWQPAGPTGFGVGTLIHLVTQAAAVEAS